MKPVDTLLLLVLLILLTAIAWMFTSPNVQSNIVQSFHSVCVIGIVILGAFGFILLLIAGSRR